MHSINAQFSKLNYGFSIFQRIMWQTQKDNYKIFVTKIEHGIIQYYFCYIFPNKNIYKYIMSH